MTIFIVSIFAANLAVQLKCCNFSPDTVTCFIDGQSRANSIALQSKLEPPLAIIRLMTWDELQDLHLEVAREVGAERGLRVQFAEPEGLHDAAFEVKPLIMPRWGFFRRRPKLREIALAFYQQDDQTQPYCITGSWVSLNELDKLNASAYRRDLAVAIRNSLVEAENMRRIR